MIPTSKRAPKISSRSFSSVSAPAGRRYPSTLVHRICSDLKDNAVRRSPTTKKASSESRLLWLMNTSTDEWLLWLMNTSTDELCSTGI